MTLLLDGEGIFKLAAYLSQVIQYVEDRSEEIRDFCLLKQMVTIEIIMNATHLSYGSVWKTIQEELHISKVSAC